MKKLPSDIQQRVPCLVSNLQEVAEVNAIMLFGSIVHEGLKPLSDIDIAVHLAHVPDRNRMGAIASELTNIVADTLRTEEFDLVIMNTAPLRFAYHILKGGRLLFVRDEAALVDFRERMVKHYLDFAYYRVEFNRAFLEGIGYHGRTHS